MSDEDYRGLMETVYLHSQPGVVESILRADAEPLAAAVDAAEVDW